MERSEVKTGSLTRVVGPAWLKNLVPGGVLSTHSKEFMQEVADGHIGSSSETDPAEKERMLFIEGHTAHEETA